MVILHCNCHTILPTPLFEWKSIDEIGQLTKATFRSRYAHTHGTQ